MWTLKTNEQIQKTGNRVMNSEENQMFAREEGDGQMNETDERESETQASSYKTNES